MHYVLHVKWSEKEVQTPKYVKRERYKAQFSSKSTNESDLLVSGFVLTLENVCTTFCMQNGVKRPFKCRNILNRNEIAHNFPQNRRMIAICESLGAFRCWKTYALRSACKME